MEISLPFSVDECKPRLPAIDKSDLGTEERTVVEASFHHTKVGRNEKDGSLSALCGIDARQRPVEDVHMEFDGGSDTSASC